MRHEVSGMRHEVSGMRHEVRGMRHEVRGMRHEVRGMRHEVRGMSVPLVLMPPCLMPHASYPMPTHPKYRHRLVHVSSIVTQYSPGTLSTTRSQIHLASSSAVGFSSPSISLRR